MTGAIGGSNSTDLMKTGNGVLELSGLNTYQGNTLIHAGTLVVGSGASLGTAGSPTGTVVVGKGAGLAGNGTIQPEVDRFVIVNPGAAIRGGSPVTNSPAEHTGTLTIRSDLTIYSSATERGTIQFELHRTAANTADASKIEIGVPFNLNLNPGAGHQFAIELVDTGVTAAPVEGETYTITLASVNLESNIRLNGVNLPDGVIDQSNYVLQSSSFTFDPSYTLAVLTDATNKHLQLTFSVAPVPEPAAALIVAVSALGLGGLIRRR
jgi:autotransporter-associated beta strand protein